MKKFNFIALLVSVGLTLPAIGATVQFGASVGAAARKVYENDGVTLDPTGSLILAGIFTNSGSFTYNPAVSVLANVNAMETLGFQPWGYTNTYSSATGTWTPESSETGLDFTVNGTNQATGTVGSTPSGSLTNSFTNQQIYLVIFNGTTVTASTQMGIFTSTSWLFPNPTGTTGILSTGTATTVTPVSNAGSVNTSPSNQLELAATPEPSTLATLFGATGVLALLRRRRSE